jgi:hypothetical protein
MNAIDLKAMLETLVARWEHETVEFKNTNANKQTNKTSTNCCWASSAAS